MAWSRRRSVGLGHFIDPGVRCQVCGDEADACVDSRSGCDHYCRFCLIIVTSEWRVHGDGTWR